jgi:threonine/homoserine/homoserine lactone efflux protein
MGRAGGIASVAGITTATFLYVALATAGLSSLVLASTVAFDVVKYAGAAYLLFLGVRRLLGRDADEETEERAPRTLRRAYTQGFVVNLSNPKLIVFVFALLPQFIDPHASRPWLQTLVLGLSFTALAFLTDSLYAVAAGSVADRLRGTDRIRRVQRWVGGSVLVGLGLLAAVWSPSPSR